MTAFQIDTDSVLNVFRRREQIRYKHQLTSEDVGLAYFNSDKVVSGSAISLIDYSSEIIVNKSVEGDVVNVVDNSNEYESETDQFYVTDIFVTDINTMESTPLFFQHHIGLDQLSRLSDTDLTLNSINSLTEVKILDEGFNEVSVSDYELDLDKGILYNNLQSGWNVAQQKYRYYYIKYTYSTSTKSFTYFELLDNRAIFSLANETCLDENLDMIPTLDKIYYVQQIDNGYLIQFPLVSTYGLKLKDSAKLKVVVPENLSLDDDWFLRITNGKFSAEVNGLDYEYRIKEFNTQNWDPALPTKRVEVETSTYIDETTLKLNRENIARPEDGNFHISIQVNDSDESGLVSMTTDPDLEGTLADNGIVYALYNTIDKIGIRSVDFKSGIVDIEGFELSPDYQIISSYYFTETDFEFIKLNLNPIKNLRSTDYTLTLFVDPLFENQSVFYALSDMATQQIIDSDYPDLEGTSLEIFLDESSVLGNGYILVLGKIFVGSQNRLEDSLPVSDIRVIGGGVKESLLEEAKVLNPEIAWYWNQGFWDGVPYPNNASYLVEIPADVLLNAGGIFNQNQVREIINRHTALGVYPAVKAYGPDPIPTTIIPYRTSVHLHWRSYGTSYYYNIYYKQNFSSPWILSNGAPMVDNGTDNSYTITGLTYGVSYYIVIVGGILDSSGTWIPLSSQHVGPVDDGAKNLNGSNIIRIKTFGTI